MITMKTTPIEEAKRKWAYAYLIGGCSSQTPKYMGYIYNVLLASRNQIQNDVEEHRCKITSILG